MNKTINEYADIFHNELLDSCAPFWVKYGTDRQYGGLLNCLDRIGKVYSGDKSVWMQGRCAWTYSRLCRKYGVREEWLTLAKSCLDFLERFCIDRTDGRMYFLVTREGLPLRKRRYFFSETFYIMANAEYYAVTGDREALERARKYFSLVLDWYRNPAKDPYRITPKFVPGTRDTLSLAPPMILLNVAAVLSECDPERKNEYERLRLEFASEVVGNFWKPEKDAMFECVGKNGEYLGDSASTRVVNPGHCMEVSWFLLDAGLECGDEELCRTAAEIFQSSFRRGWDPEYGGILYFVDYEGYPVEAYEHDMKLWWPHNEAILASLKFLKATGEKKFFEIFEKVWKYAYSHFADGEYGEWFGYLRRDGIPTQPPCKGHTYKGPFHVMRMLMEGESVLRK